MSATKKTRGLGKGLDSIFIDNSAETESGAPTMLRISEIEPRKGQPRKTFDKESLANLADSIAAHGVIQPITVRPQTNGFYQIIAGERRWRAAKMAGLKEVPVIIIDADDQKTSEIALIENVQREDLNPIEEAQAYKTLIEEYGLTQESLSKRVGKSRSAIANSVRLLDLPESVMNMVASGTLSAGHAKALLGLTSKADIPYAADMVVNRGLSVRQTETLVRNINKSNLLEEEPEESQEIKVDYIASLEKKVTERLGRRVKISNKGKTKKVELFFEDDKDLEAIIESLCGKEIFND